MTTREQCINDILGHIEEAVLDASQRTDQQVDAEGMSEAARLMRLGRDIGYWGENGQAPSRLVEARD